MAKVQAGEAQAGPQGTTAEAKINRFASLMRVVRFEREPNLKAGKPWNDGTVATPVADVIMEFCQKGEPCGLFFTGRIQKIEKQNTPVTFRFFPPTAAIGGGQRRQVLSVDKENGEAVAEYEQYQNTIVADFVTHCKANKVVMSAAPVQGIAVDPADLGF